MKVLKITTDAAPEIIELRAAIAVCENELAKGTHLHQENLFLYCAAMQNLTTSLETQMDESQKKTYKRLLERCTVITTVK